MATTMTESKKQVWRVRAVFADAETNITQEFTEEQLNAFMAKIVKDGWAYKDDRNNRRIYPPCTLRKIEAYLCDAIRR